MATIRPFRGLRFTDEAGRLDLLVAPPYDVLSPAQRDEFGVRSKHNIVHLTLPEQSPDDRSKFVRYARSAALLAEWRRDGTLAPEPEPSFYRYTQTFTLHGQVDKYTRTSVIALIKTEPYSKGIVLPHEQTFPKHKEDRLRILEATRAHLECIFGLYEDPDGNILAALNSAEVGSTVEVRSDDLVEQKLEPISSPEACEKLTQLLADKKVWIADGHHRYETAVAYREAQGEKEGLIPEDFMMMALSSMSDPGLVLLPTHRIISHLPFDSRTLLEKIGEYFNITKTHSSRLMELIGISAADGVPAFAMALEGGNGYVLTAKNLDQLHALAGDEGSAALRALDVTVLHRVIFDKILELKSPDLITYTRDPYEAVSTVDEGSAVSFLMNPPSVEDMRVIANGGELMPQKSTYYFPKILSGLVLWSLNDF
jgi:uncharacterized protein (DUF1015 family)